MSMTALFISDLHLCEQRPLITELFLRFLDERAAKATSLYILGDFFEYWIGDENAELPALRPIVARLRTLTDAGVAVHLMHGNRDFLIGERFERLTGARLLPDPSVVELAGTPTLLMHGDTLCTDDVEYMAFRREVRDPATIRAFLAKSIPERHAIARQYRDASRASTRAKAPEIMDVNDQAVREALRAHGVSRLIHGHTHRPGRHVLEVEGRRCERIVLGDWYEQGSVLRVDRDGCVLESLPLARAQTKRAAPRGRRRSK